ncbi:MAG: TonB-dependent receptor, partial [Litorimonas sp.]
QFTNEGFELRLEAVQAEIGAWQGAYGGQIRIRDFGAFNLEDGGAAFIPPSTTEQYGIYTFQEYNEGPLHLEGALRYERTDVENDFLDINRDFDAFSVSAGGGYDVTEELTLTGNVFRTQRAPSAEELFSDGAHLATAQFEIGDVDLNLEKSIGGEVSLKYNGERISITLNAFYTDFDDYIFQQETGEIIEGLTEVNFTGSDVEFRGFEAQGNVNLTQFNGFSIDADALVEVVRADGDDVGNLPRIPPLGGLVGISAKSDYLSLRAELDWATEQDNTATFELPTDGFTQVNLFASYNAEFAGQDVTFRVSALNLFDTEARQHTSFLKDILSLPGRNFKFSLSTAF